MPTQCNVGGGKGRLWEKRSTHRKLWWGGGRKKGKVGRGEGSSEQSQPATVTERKRDPLTLLD